ncbi:Uncharacterized protein HZ326_24003 [Fusarium oxysporum f. sp. albedinis]|nr:Uncharacterized protein HZ326_24003 [Fusarium oxysporum f. sp. albedinis]
MSDGSYLHPVSQLDFEWHFAWCGDDWSVSVHIQNFQTPAISNDTDAIVSITTSALCGSDLHRYHGYVGGEPP